MQVRGHEQAIDLFENFIEVRQDQANGGSNNTRSQAGQTAQDQSTQAATQQDERGGLPLLHFAQENLPTLKTHLRSARSIRKTMQSGPDVAANQPSQSQRSPADGRSEQSRTRDGDTARRFVVEQPRPRVTVTDPRSQVNVEQPRPRVTVRQQAPTVTIDQPPPEVVIHMPPPNVDVQDREPKVSVNVPPPQVNVEQQAGSARVQVQGRSDEAADEAAQVQYQRARPQVKFERAGEPRVVYRPTEQEPKVRYESERQSAASTRQQQVASSRSGSTAQSSDAQTDAQQSATARRERQGEQNWRDRARQLTRAEETSSTTSGRGKSDKSADSNLTQGAGIDSSATLMLVSRINDMPVYNARGQKLGEVEEVVVDENTNARFVILASGGFLGLFQDEVALPVERVHAKGDHLVVSGLTDQDIDNMQDWEDRLPNSSVLDDAQSVRIRK
jgi:sporulation protein YlmC with PRC-barrel domain